ncbi:AraC family transcriptional regulator [Paenibacillus radicis (ex Gao et al. 2016)]|uniref:HTH araC/xylS-type domain-containing protein n=1 Tax=Paenibacillus radicis (ex Gao et al. 2016) TaxID=1737354 RepID=A0A917M339_9BACL|nr:AraC family transcriptional regulator [Paenibacillus radicis (ex Gao et al. 2016)]GGG73877.1 hypothetical protein GCM10010918_32420 [Paenibacillus radicis (ex Gao et al. 2016)]
MPEKLPDRLHAPVVLTYSGTDELKLSGGRQTGFCLQYEHCFIYIPQSKMKVTLRSRTQKSSGKALGGELFLVPAGHACTLRNRADQPVEAVVIRFTTDGYEPLIGQAEFHTFRMPQIRMWISDFRCDMAGGEQDDPAQFFQLQSQLYSIASGFMQSVQKPREAEQDLLGYVEHTLQHMHDHYSDMIDIEELARSSGFSTGRFYQSFRRHTGLSPLKYMTKIRLDASLRLLAGGRTTITDTAHAVGYPDEYYFSRLFKKQMGMSPSDYALKTKLRIANMTPVFLGDLSVLGITPHISFERGWTNNPEPAYQQLAAAEPELILTGPLEEEVYAALSAIAPVKMMYWKRYSWKERLLDMSGELGLSGVAERWLSSYDMKVANARIHVKNVLGDLPMLLVQSFEGGFRVYGTKIKKMKDVFYDDLRVKPPLPAKQMSYMDAESLEQIAELDCDNVMFLVPVATPQSHCDELESAWRRLKPSRSKKRCLFIRHRGVLNYNAAVYENLVEETVRHLLTEAKDDVLVK